MLSRRIKCFRENERESIYHNNIGCVRIKNGLPKERWSSNEAELANGNPEESERKPRPLSANSAWTERNAIPLLKTRCGALKQAASDALKRF